MGADMRLLLVAAVLVWCTWGCGSSPAAPIADAPVPGTAPPPDVPAATVRFFGVVTNEDGVPLSGAMVGVTYVPDSGPAQVVNAQTSSDGRYEFQLNARQPGNVNAVIKASASGDYVTNEQLVRLAAATERNMRLRRVRTIGVGQSTTIAFDADSSLCSTSRTGGICEWVRIQFPNVWVARLVVKASPEADGVVPTLLTNFGFPPIQGQSAVSLPVGDDDFWDPRVPRFVDVMVSIPAATTAQRYEVLLYAAP